MDIIGKFFKGGASADKGDKDAGSSRDVTVATCALLLEMSRIDGEFSPDERERIISLLEKDYSLSHEYAEELLRASEHELEGSIDLWQFTNLINQNYTLEEKEKIMETVWKIAYTDGNLDKHEGYMAHKTARLLRLSHKQLIDAKLKVKGKVEKSADGNLVSEG